MIYKWYTQSTSAYLHMIVGECPSHFTNLEVPKAKLLSIVWNRGEDQEIKIDGVPHPFPANSIVPLMGANDYGLTNPETVVTWQFNREFYCIIDHDKEVSCVGFIFYGTRDHLIIDLDEKNQGKLETLQAVFKDEFEEATDIKEEMLRMLLKRLIILITRLGKQQYASPELSEPEIDIIREFNLLLEQHFKELHQVQDYANLMHKSPKTLSNLFAKYNSKSPLLVIKDRLLEEARRLLAYSDMTTKEIAYELGFDDPSTFSRFFKKGMEVSPTEWKKGAVG